MERNFFSLHIPTFFMLNYIISKQSLIPGGIFGFYPGRRGSLFNYDKLIEYLSIQ